MRSRRDDEEIDLFADENIRERVPIVRVTDRRMSPQSNHELEELKVRMVMRIENCSREVAERLVLEREIERYLKDNKEK